MYDKPGFEIPEAVRDMAQKNVEQARSAYKQFIDMAQQAQDMAAKSQGQMVEQALGVQTKALKYAESNVEAGFRFASELAKAKDLQEYVEIQTRHAQQQMKSFQDQAAELGKLMSEAAKQK